MKISVYTSLFNIEKFFPNFRDNFANYFLLAHELVVATIKENPRDWAILTEEALKDPRIKVVLTELIKDSPGFDGWLKDAALKGCSGDILIQLDGDEKISDYNLDKWRVYCNSLFTNPYYKALFIPSVNLHGDNQSFSHIGKKWYAHKRGLNRGVVGFARRPDGTHDTNASDSCELIDENNNLVLTAEICPRQGFTEEEYAKLIKEHDLPVVFHYGYEDLNRRVSLNTDFWHRMWAVEEGKEVEIPLDLKGLEKKIWKHEFILPK